MSNLITRRVQVIEQANERGFTVAGKPAHLSGYRLDYPVARQKSGPVEAPISWALAERLANGTSTKVLL